MHSFVDSLGRVWPVQINVAAVKRVQGLLGVNLYGVADEGMRGLAGLLDDPVKLVDVLYVLCRDQADAAKVSDEDFGRGLGGDSYRLAAEAFVEELADFFPDPRRRQVLRAVIAKTRQLADLAGAQALAELEAVDPATLLATLRGSSGGAPASSASTPAP